MRARDGFKGSRVSAPLVVLLHDRTFCSGSFAEAWRRRPGLYLGLAATWLVFLPFYAKYSGGGGLWAGSGVPVRWYEYAWSQPGVLVRYLRLCFWPQGQCAVYDLPIARAPSEIMPPMFAIGALVALTLWALVHRPAWGFLGAWFFLVLAPTSSVMPINDLAFEHRMYLSSAAVVVGTVMAAHAALNSWSADRAVHEGRIRASLVVCTVVALSAITIARNTVYAGPAAFWTDVLAKRPHSFRAHLSLGKELAAANHLDAAIEHYLQALEANLNFPEAYIVHCNQGGCYKRLGRTDEAFQHFSESVRLHNGFARSRLNLGICLAQRGEYRAALEHLRTGLELDPDLPGLRGWLGTVEFRLGDLAGAEEHLRQELERNPDEPVVHLSLADLLARQGMKAEAAEHYRHVLRMKPDHERARRELASLADDRTGT